MGLVKSDPKQSEKESVTTISTANRYSTKLLARVSSSSPASLLLAFVRDQRKSVLGTSIGVTNLKLEEANKKGGGVMVPLAKLKVTEKSHETGMDRTAYWEIRYG